MAQAKDKGSIVLRGGGILKVKKVNDDGSELSPTPDTATDLGYVEAVGSVIATSNDNDVMDETGVVVAHNDGDTSFKLTGTFLQTNKDLFDFIRGTKGNFYQVYYKMTPTGKMNGETQELFGGIGRFKQQFEIKSGTKKAPFEITFLNNDADITVTTPHTVYDSVVTDLTGASIGAGNAYELTEN